MHIGHINVDNKKMSKSLNNFVLAKDILAKYDANTIRWFFFQTQYTSPLNFSFENLEISKNEILKIFKSINNALINLYANKNNFKHNNKSKLPELFVNAIENDLDFPNMITTIWSYTKNLSNLIKTKKYDEINENINSLINMFSILGIKHKNPLESIDSKKIVDN